MEIDYINGLKTDEIYGMSKYQKGILQNINTIQLNRIEYPNVNPVINTLTRYSVYPFIVKKDLKKENIKHITSQDLAYILKFVKMERSVVTCHDLIPVVYDKTRSPVWKLNMEGLKKSDRIITISDFSKTDIVKHLDYPEDQIRIASPAVNHSTYFEKRDRGVLAKHNIKDNEKVILYVGSEQPRKNVPNLIKAFSKLKNKFPYVKLLKIGKPQHPSARKELLELIDLLKLNKDVVFIGYISEEELTKYYNAADLFIFPSLYEGFGLPPLEAMACGTPVITSNTSSLPEVVDDSGIMVDPFDIDSMATQMYDILTNEALHESLVKKGLKRARMFTWKDTAKKTMEVYNELSM
ncbi:glycosyltransferase family 4 protein [Methanolobus chelungpuianus]|uniref:Mannosyltransferase n=1 Tax=Methanolobus chelungpuianus TaxID=502115 RepID=A0AAE3HAN7_9EURY|nr:glycosyltransferase family 1 protein [Methanolobus chelungpuianus]MCQ6963212.1 mannosyltransferase [Methanolobus chelungpuianus]